MFVKIEIIFMESLEIKDALLAFLTAECTFKPFA